MEGALEQSGDPSIRVTVFFTTVLGAMRVSKQTLILAAELSINERNFLIVDCSAYLCRWTSELIPSGWLNLRPLQNRPVPRCHQQTG